MLIVDTALKKRESEGNPVRVGVIGAGYMGRGMIHQIMGSVPGMTVAALSNRTISRAEQAFTQTGVEDYVHVDSQDAMNNAIRDGRCAITEDPMLVAEADGIDAIVEATGEVEFGAQVVLRAIEHGKHVILMNAELDAVVGPILKVYADKAGVVISNVDGDQPGVVMNLLRWVESIGYEPVLAGNIKGLQDCRRTPETQKGFAEAVKQNTKMITSFADGTKISMEMAVVANATGFTVDKRGMHGPECKHVTEALNFFDADKLREGGIVDYVLGAEPGPGVFVLGYSEDSIKQQYGQYLKMGDGPLYTFYIPYHLPHLESPLTVARAVLFDDAAIAPAGAPVVEVLTSVKFDLQEGKALDGIGGFDVYGVTENVAWCREHNALPMSLADGCVMRRDMSQDEIISYDDVIVPEGRVCDRLWQEQLDHFG
ncbi:MAG: Gfo/Idh/MocA family oxidoreductase [Pseudomonadota bacterium]